MWSKSTAEEVYQDVNESFCILRGRFFMSIFTHYRLKCLVNVILYLPWSADSFKAYLFGFYFYLKFMANEFMAKLVLVQFLWTVIITMQYLFMFMDSE